MEKKKLIIIAGPTAVGKTSLVIKLAKKLKKEIISADSRQIYKGMEIGTAKPSPSELKEVPHHLISFLDQKETYNAAKYEEDAIKKINALFKKENIVFLSGGTGLYIDAVCKGIDYIPDIDQNLRISIKSEFEKKGINHLLNELKLCDPDYYAFVDKKNHARILRAIEVIRQTKKPFSSFRKNQQKKRSFDVIKFALYRDKENILSNIHSRTKQMISKGLIDEAKELIKNSEYIANKTIGYKELIPFFSGKVDLEKAIQHLNTNTWQYAKRQITWLKKDKKTIWIHADQPDPIEKLITIHN